MLLLNSYHPQYPWTKALTDAVSETLDGRVKSENLHIDYLDGRFMIDNATYRQTLKQRIEVKYAKINPDVIIASDDYAVNFLLEEGDRIFPGVPVVYVGVNFLSPELANRDNYIGIIEGVDIEGNINLMLNMLPDTESLILLCDSTNFGQHITKLAEEIINTNRTTHGWEHVDFDVWNNFTLPVLYERLSVLPDNTAVLLLAIHSDKDGRYFSYTDDLPDLTTASNSPVYGMFGAVMLGQGIVGGNINSPMNQGKHVATLALNLLSGASISDLPKSTMGSFSPKFDYRALKRFNISANQLPQGSTIVFEPHSNVFKTEQLTYALVAIVVITSLGLVFYNNVRRRVAEEKANTDALTKLPNRRAADEWLSKQWTLSTGHQKGFAIGILDIDHFKRVNDEYGHDIGDTVLIHISKRIQKVLRNSDRLYRWGGEEFVIYFDFVDPDTLDKVGNRLLHAIRHTPIEPAGTITASLGIAISSDFESLESLLIRADTALYYVKQNGRDNLSRVSAS
ncbi:hypothetical protein KUL49_30000 [Alteromonas sp. KUL49]|nr:hypothetical protein KUL49_30000 [Alteromonas sp. KUL49]